MKRKVGGPNFSDFGTPLVDGDGLGDDLNVGPVEALN